MAKRIEQLEPKGMVQQRFTCFINAEAGSAGIPTHVLDALVSDHEVLVKSWIWFPSSAYA